MTRPSFACGLAVLTLSATVAGCGASHSNSSGSTAAPGRAASVNTLLKQGIAQAEANKLTQATTTFEDILAISPTNKYALYNLGVIAQKRRDPTGAVARYDQALKADTTYTPAMYNKALILETSNANGALALYQRIVMLNPKASTAYLRMAIVYAKQGKLSQAKQARAKAVALDQRLASYRMPSPCTAATC